MRETTTNDERPIAAPKGRSRRALFCFVFFVCFACSAINLNAQNLDAQNLDVLAATIARGDAEQKREALRVIRNLESESAARVAVLALRDSSEIVRATAAFSVVFLPADEAFAALVPLLSDKKELVRREAAYALGKVRNRAAAAPLLRVFQKDKIAEVRNACVVALGEIGDVAAIDALVAILRKKPKSDDEADDFLRRAAARSVGQIAQITQTGNAKVVTPQILSAQPSFVEETPNSPALAEQFPVFRSAVPVLIDILQNENEANDAKREAAFALGAIGDASAMRVLQSNLTNEDYYLAQISREALRKIELGMPQQNAR